VGKDQTLLRHISENSPGGFTAAIIITALYLGTETKITVGADKLERRVAL